MRWRSIYWSLVPFVAVNFLATLALIPVYKPTSYSWRAGCLEMVAGTLERAGKTITRIWGRPLGQCLGAPAQWYKSKRHRDRKDLVVHERTHTFQGLFVNAAAAVVLGALCFATGFDDWWSWPLFSLHQVAFGIAYGLHFVYRWAAGGFKSWKAAYYRIWAERTAYRIQGEYKEGKRPHAWGG